MSEIKSRLANLLAMSNELTPVADRATLSPESGIPRGSPRTGVGMSMQATKMQATINALQAQLDSSIPGFSKLRLEDIGPNPWHPRTILNQKSLDMLVESMSVNGLIQPIVVRKDPIDEKKYQLVVGKRRMLAAQALGWLTIPAILSDVSDDKMAVHSLTANLARKKRSDYATGKALSMMTKNWPSRRFSPTAFGISEEHMHHCLSFEKLPQFVLDDLETSPNLLDASVAYEIAQELEQQGVDGQAVLKEAWTQFVAGVIDEQKMLDSIRTK